MSAKDELKVALRTLRDALTYRQGQLGIDMLTARWSGAMLRAAGDGPSHQKSAWQGLAEEPQGGKAIVEALKAAAEAISSATSGSASAALTRCEGALKKLESLFGA